MKSQNSPVDIGEEQIQTYKHEVEETLSAFTYKGERNLADLIRRVDTEEHQLMSDLDRDTYLAIREGMQIYNAVVDKLTVATELGKKLAYVTTGDAEAEAEIEKLRDFCNSYGAYAASLYISKKTDHAVRSRFDVDDEDVKHPVKLESKHPTARVMKYMLAPVYDQLVRHAEGDDGETKVYEQPWQFSKFVSEVFSQYAALASEDSHRFGNLNDHVNNYRFRIMDEFITLDGWEDNSVAQTNGTKSEEISFTAISPNEIVGNRDAKRKITRLAERLCLYDPQEQMNPILELGGLQWTTLFDGLPGTGKSSMFRMLLTIAKQRAEQIGLPYNFFFVDQDIKDEYYGKTGKKLLGMLPGDDADSIWVGIMDDLDLLTSTRNDAQGADNDINNILMQYLDGARTVRRGNIVNMVASNKPTGLDGALRNRMNDRLLVDGPVTAEDFADIFMLQNKQMIDRGLIRMKTGYEPFATQDMRLEDGTWTAEDVASYGTEEFRNQFKGATIHDFGAFMEELREKNPRITGRSAAAISEAIRSRAADFDIPAEWFEDRSLFFDLPYDQKVKKVGDLYVPITPEILFEEAQRYFDSEERYNAADSDEAVESGYNSIVWNAEAKIKAAKSNPDLLVEAQLAESLLRQKAREVLETNLDAKRHAMEADESD